MRTLGNSYYANYRLSERIIQIWDPLYVSATLILGDEKALLFDTAWGIGNLREHVAGLTDLPLIIVNSHGHLDHAGGNYQFDQDIYIHEAEIPVAIAHASPRLREITITDAKKADALPPDFEEEEYRSFYLPGRLIPIQEGHRFDLGGVTLEAISTPGHSPGAISLLYQEERILLVGDAANGFMFLFFEESTSLITYLKTLYKLHALDFDSLILSHQGPPMLLPKSRIEMYIHCAENIKLENSEPFHFAPFPDRQAFIYCEKAKKPSNLSETNDPEFAAIVYSMDKLQS